MCIRDRLSAAPGAVAAPPIAPAPTECAEEGGAALPELDEAPPMGGGGSSCLLYTSPSPRD
eukprot:8849289-Alexandrium_andersonii.AAC.1